MVRKSKVKVGGGRRKEERLKFSAEGGVRRAKDEGRGRRAKGGGRRAKGVVFGAKEQGESCVGRFWVSASSIRYYTR